jgi:hypothetical protein
MWLLCSPSGSAQAMRCSGIREAENCKRAAMTGFFCYEFVTFIIDFVLEAAINSCKKQQTTIQ